MSDHGVSKPGCFMPALHRLFCSLLLAVALLLLTPTAAQAELHAKQTHGEEVTQHRNAKITELEARLEQERLEATQRLAKQREEFEKKLARLAEEEEKRKAELQAQEAERAKKLAEQQQQQQQLQQQVEGGEQATGTQQQQQQQQKEEGEAVATASAGNDIFDVSQLTASLGSAASSAEVPLTKQQRRILRRVCHKWRAYQGRSLSDELIGAASLLKEANIYSVELNKSAEFQFTLTRGTEFAPGEKDTTLMIDVRDRETGEQLDLWSFSRFREMLFQMQDYYHSAIGQAPPTAIGDPFPAKVPWFVTVGRGFSSMKNLLFNVPVEHQV